MTADKQDALQEFEKAIGADYFEKKKDP